MTVMAYYNFQIMLSYLCKSSNITAQCVQKCLLEVTLQLQESTAQFSHRLTGTRSDLPML